MCSGALLFLAILRRVCFRVHLPHRLPVLAGACLVRHLEYGYTGMGSGSIKGCLRNLDKLPHQKISWRASEK